MKWFALIACVLIIDSVDRVSASPVSNESSYYGEGVADCKWSRQEFISRMKEVKCRPRKSLEKLNADRRYIFLPNVVPVNRCEGFCGDELACMPTRVQRKLILVKRSRDVLSYDMICYRVYVEEHTQCRCKCKVTEKDCNEYQQYKADECACKCNNFQEQGACTFRRKMVWNPEKCRCICAVPEEECSTGLEWIPSVCR